jgi:hypothetical protein
LETNNAVSEILLGLRGVVMFSSSERRRRAIDAQYQASRAIDEKVKEAFEELAHNWLSLAEQAEWLAAQTVPAAAQPVTQQQQQIQPQA